MFALGETDLCAASECEFEKGIVCKKLIRRGFRFTPYGVENANKKKPPSSGSNDPCRRSSPKPYSAQVLMRYAAEKHAEPAEKRSGRAKSRSKYL